MQWFASTNHLKISNYFMQGSFSVICKGATTIVKEREVMEVCSQKQGHSFSSSNATSTYVCMYVCMRNSTCRLFIEHVSRTNNLGINPVFVRVASAILPEKPYKFFKKISYDWQQKLSWFWKIVLYDYNVDE